MATKMAAKIFKRSYNNSVTSNSNLLMLVSIPKFLGARNTLKQQTNINEPFNLYEIDVVVFIHLLIADACKCALTPPPSAPQY